MMQLVIHFNPAPTWLPVSNSFLHYSASASHLPGPTCHLWWRERRGLYAEAPFSPSLMTSVAATSVCVWQSNSNPNCHMMFSKTQNECQLTSTFSSTMSPQCHMLGACVIQFLNVNWGVVFFLHESHYMSNSTLCVLNDVHFKIVQVFVCQMSKTCKNFVRHTHWRQPHPIQSRRDDYGKHELWCRFIIELV